MMRLATVSLLLLSCHRIAVDEAEPLPVTPPGAVWTLEGLAVWSVWAGGALLLLAFAMTAVSFVAPAVARATARVAPACAALGGSLVLGGYLLEKLAAWLWLVALLCAVVGAVLGWLWFVAHKLASVEELIQRDLDGDGKIG